MARPLRFLRRCPRQSRCSLWPSRVSSRPNPDVFHKIHRNTRSEAAFRYSNVFSRGAGNATKIAPAATISKKRNINNMIRSASALPLNDGASVHKRSEAYRRKVSSCRSFSLASSKPWGVGPDSPTSPTCRRNCPICSWSRGLTGAYGREGFPISTPKCFMADFMTGGNP